MLYAVSLHPTNLLVINISTTRRLEGCKESCKGIGLMTTSTALFQVFLMSCKPTYVVHVFIGTVVSMTGMKGMSGKDMKMVSELQI